MPTRQSSMRYHSNDSYEYMYMLFFEAMHSIEWKREIQGFIAVNIEMKITQ